MHLTAESHYLNLKSSQQHGHNKSDWVFLYHYNYTHSRQHISGRSVHSSGGWIHPTPISTALLSQAPAVIFILLHLMCQLVASFGNLTAMVGLHYYTAFWEELCRSDGSCFLGCCESLAPAVSPKWSSRAIQISFTFPLQPTHCTRISCTNERLGPGILSVLLLWVYCNQLWFRPNNGSPFDNVCTLNVHHLPGVISVPAIPVPTGWLLRSIKWCVRIRVIRFIEDKLERIRLMTPRVYDERNKHRG